MSFDTRAAGTIAAPPPPIRRRVASTPQPKKSANKALAGSFFTNPFKDIGLTPSYLAFCLYIFCIVTYRLPLGSPAMILAIATLPMEKHEIRFPPVALLTFALVGWAVVGILTTNYPDVVIDKVSEFAKVAAVVFVAVNVLVTRARIRAFLVGNAIAFSLFPVRGTLLGHFLYHADVGGRASWNYIYSNPNDLAGLTILALAITLGALAVEQKKWVRLGSILAVALMVLVIVLTQSRGALIALAAFGIIGGKKFLSDPRRIAMIVVMAIGVAALAPQSAWRRFSSLKTATSDNADLLNADLYDLDERADQGSTVQRLAIWDVAETIIAEHIVTGVGIGAYPFVHEITQQRPGFKPIARGRRDTHSTYLNLMAEMGLVGFGIFSGLIVYTVLQSRRARLKMQKRFPALALQQFYLEVGLYGYLVAAIWGSYGFFISTYVHLVLMYCCAKLLEAEGERRPTLMRGGNRPPSVQQFHGNRRVGAAV